MKDYLLFNELVSKVRRSFLCGRDWSMVSGRDLYGHSCMLNRVYKYWPSGVARKFECGRGVANVLNFRQIGVVKLIIKSNQICLLLLNGS